MATVTLANDGEHPRPPGSTAAGLVTLGRLQEALRAERRLMTMTYTRDPDGATYSPSSSVGLSRSEIDRLRSLLTFHLGEERGLVGLVAQRREPLYVPDYAADPRCLADGRRVPIGSAYVVPILSREAVPAVLCVMSSKISAFDPEHLALIDCLANVAGRLCGVEERFRSRIDRVERGLRDVSLEWRDLRNVLDAQLPAELRERLGSLSRREWEVIERLQGGQRITTMARELGISPHTVRNHVKSICRKLRVRSQDELRERIGSLRLARPLDQLA